MSLAHLKTLRVIRKLDWSFWTFIKPPSPGSSHQNHHQAELQSWEHSLQNLQQTLNATPHHTPENTPQTINRERVREVDWQRGLICVNQLNLFLVTPDSALSYCESMSLGLTVTVLLSEFRTIWGSHIHHSSVSEQLCRVLTSWAVTDLVYTLKMRSPSSSSPSHPSDLLRFLNEWSWAEERWRSGSIRDIKPAAGSETQLIQSR